MRRGVWWCGRGAYGVKEREGKYERNRKPAKLTYTCPFTVLRFPKSDLRALNCKRERKRERRSASEGGHEGTGKPGEPPGLLSGAFAAQLLRQYEQWC